MHVCLLAAALRPVCNHHCWALSCFLAHRCLQACYGADHDVAGLRDVLQQRMNEPISQQELNVLVLHPQRGFPWLSALPTASRCKF